MSEEKSSLDINTLRETLQIQVSDSIRLLEKGDVNTARAVLEGIKRKIASIMEDVDK